MARVRLSREAREKLIVEGAVNYFAEVGFGGQTRELARQLGMAQSLLFKYFPTKEDLVERVYREVYLSRWNPNWEALISNPEAPLRQRLLRFYLEYTQIMDHNWIRIFLYAGLLGSDINVHYLELLKTKIICKICHAVRKEAGLPDIADAALTERQLQLVWSLQGSVLYMAIQQHVYHNLQHDGLEEIVADRVDAFLKGVPAVFRRPRNSIPTDGPGPATKKGSPT